MEEIIEKLIADFSPGELITHSLLKQLFNISDPEINKFDNTSAFVFELQNIQFAYMSMIDKLRDDLLKNERYYLKNVRGDGYTLLPPKDQVSYAYDQGLGDIKKAIKQAKSIMMNIRYEDIPQEQLAKDNELLNKMSNFAQMFRNKRN
jgi:hypothetical protein